LTPIAGSPIGRFSRPAVCALVILAMAAGAFVSPVRAQSLSAGALSGIVRDEASRPVGGVDVTVLDDITGIRRSRITPRQGNFTFELLLPGDYSVLVQRFGYRPVVYRRVPVRAGSRIELQVTLVEGTPGTGVDTVAYPGVPAGGAHVALHGGPPGDDFAELADQSRLATGASSLLPGTDGDLGAEGLPGRLGALAVDGMPRWSPRHPRVMSGELDGAAFPQAGVRAVELLSGGFDAEWPGATGGVLAVSTVPGSRDFTTNISASAGPEGQSAAIIMSGAAVKDTAHFAIGFAGTRLAPELPSPWLDSSISAATAGIAQDSFNTDLSPYRATYTPVTTNLTGFGRFDWIAAPGQLLSVRMSASKLTADDPALGPDQPVSLGSQLLSSDYSLAAALTSVIAVRFGNEFRAAVDGGTHTYNGISLPGTVFPDAGLAAGSSALLPGSFKRLTARFSETGHMRFTAGTLKAGFQFAFNSFDQTYTDGRAGTYYFGDSTGFATRTGAFRQTVGTLPAAKFSTSTVAFFSQLMLHPSEGLSVLLGFRAERNTPPTSDLRQNAEWLRLTGIDNTAVGKPSVLILPRGGLAWTLGAAHRWQVVAAGGLFTEQDDPGEWAEAITHATGAQVRRGNGALGAWPGVPDSTVAPVIGQSLTLLGANYRPPRTGRGIFSIVGNLNGTILRLQGNYRHTDFLPMRRDLNLALNTRAQDQYGRPLYGTLDKFGGVLAAVPGSNRRFAGFDDVSSLDPAAYSDYYGFTVGLERDLPRGLGLMAMYTYSKTTDNWFGARASGAEGQFSPVTDSAGIASWVDGRSDFDVPHRLTLGAMMRFGARARLAVLYRWRSGYPFTPGFRDGVDANGDGSARNDPAFVTDTVAGAADVIAANSCLTSQVGQLAERNSCREPSLGSLELRLAIGLGRLGGKARTELLIDAYNVMMTGADVTDHALYLVDPARPLSTNATTGVTTVPLLGNPNFGQPLVKRKLDPAFRLGLRIEL
jgi:hypothetical protein